MNVLKYVLLSVFIAFISCKKATELTNEKINNQIEFANGLEIHNYADFTVMKVTKPWPNAEKSFTYVCAKSNKEIPDSLSKYPFIQVPVKNLVVTSTTHISSVVALNHSDKLVGFPNLNYISSAVVRKKIAQGGIQELSDKENLNFEKTVDLQPQIIVGLSMDSETSKFNQFEKAGIPVLYNADWVETSPLGKAEWVKFFGVLFDQQQKADEYFNNIVSEYTNAKKLVENVRKKPTVLSGAIFQDVWYVPQGESWMAAFIKDAGGNYLWSHTKGTGSLSLSLEAVLDKALNANIWIGPGEFTTYNQMTEANKHYEKFAPYQNKQIYSYSIKKGPTGGIVFYEDAPNRPDLVLKDFISILHPELLSNYKPVFIEPLK
ncbi:ABC transporter substrate-binding protein [Flavobacterium sp. CBA20B-1]|uniref:ABC transporter substrate-binding protein n=1 Tax=unclassified Flavobacterium TaxID=196869 RepID=UPI0022259306|nr:MULTISPECIES: ABC transporter substrate-binding protein [unclassified Flavobacterium]WCM42690.1 ABC transporter substrate-binding protein [Flavobacterium sp. CBA20B-1]